MMEGLDLLFGLFGLGCGLYCMYSAYMMKKTGIINETLLVDQVTRTKKCKDKTAFIQETNGQVWLLGIAATLYGTVCLLHAYVIKLDVLLWVIMALFFADLVMFSIKINKVKKKYY